MAWEIESHRNIHTRAVCYGNPQFWEHPEHWEPVHVLTEAELLKLRSESRQAGYDEGNDDGYYEGLGDYYDLLSMMRDKVRDWERGIQPASVVLANIKDILDAEES